MLFAACFWGFGLSRDRGGAGHAVAVFCFYSLLVWDFEVEGSGCLTWCLLPTLIRLTKDPLSRSMIMRLLLLSTHPLLRGLAFIMSLPTVFTTRLRRAAIIPSSTQNLHGRNRWWCIASSWRIGDAAERLWEAAKGRAEDADGAGERIKLVGKVVVVSQLVG